MKFQQKNDTKAALNVPVIYTPAGVSLYVSLLSFTDQEITFIQAISAAVVFYNAPTPAPGIFDDFLAIPTNQSDVKTRSFADMLNSLAVINTPNIARLVIARLWRLNVADEKI